MDAADRLRSVRERLEAAVFGISELDHLRQRQRGRVRAALDKEEQEEKELRGMTHLNPEENLLMLRKQLNCLRRRDTGLISQLQELDQQINDLRLDTEASHDQLEADSRPSSGFYELSDGASGSLSNSSHSVFSECFSSAADTDGHFPSTEELAICREKDVLVGGLCDDSSSSDAVCQSLSARHPHHMDAASSVVSTDFQSIYHCNLLTQNGTNIYRYPSPLCTVAIESSTFLHTFCNGGHVRDEAYAKCLKLETLPIPESASNPLIPKSPYGQPSLSCYSKSHSQNKMDGYICSLLQRRAQLIRTSRPRTSISMDPSKNIRRQASLHVRQAFGTGSGLGTLRVSEKKPSWPAGGIAEGSIGSKEQDTQNAFLGHIDMMQTGFKINNSDIQNSSSVTNGHIYTNTNSLMSKRGKEPPLHTAVSIAAPLKDFRDMGSPPPNSSPKETFQLCCSTHQELLFKSPPPVKVQSGSPKKSPKTLHSGPTENSDRSVLEVSTRGTSFHILGEEGGVREGGRSRMVNSRYCPAKTNRIKLCKDSSKSIKTTKKNTMTIKTIFTSENNELPLERKGDKYHKSNSRKLRLLEDRGSTHNKVSKKGSSRMKCIPTSISESQVQDKNATSQRSNLRSGVFMHHHHGNHHHNRSNNYYHRYHRRRNHVVVATPKYKQNDNQRLHTIMEIPYGRLIKQAQWQHKKGLSGSATNMHSHFGGQQNSPCSDVAGSDSEYSAECMSLFHSTIVDTSDDESNYTTNCFGDSESSAEDYVEESTTTSDTEESVRGGAGGGQSGMGRGWGELGAVRVRLVGQEITPAKTKALVKVKASYNLKKKILSFRSGSLKLMTTV
ncbi:dapper homolog 1 [Odontesthes bonariensis]|uniref:dapper homolog 1 n=1 Tax=Odontesthes bonariensis TaxID=219752 RepID=UPI003F58FFA3